MNCSSPAAFGSLFSFHKKPVQDSDGLCCTGRGIVGKKSCKAQVVYYLQMVIMTVLSLLVGVLYYRLDQNAFNIGTVINDRLGAMFFIAMNQIFTNIPAVDFFIKQRALFM